MSPARSVAKHALTIFNDHSDVMACRQTGMAQLCAHSVQEVMDLSLVSHLSTIQSRIPFMHFFDGYRTSAEVKKINVIPYTVIEDLIDQEALQKNLRDLALNPTAPTIRGTGQRPDISSRTRSLLTSTTRLAPISYRRPWTASAR